MVTKTKRMILRGKVTAKHMWEALAKHYQAADVENQIDVNTALIELKMGDCNDDVTEFVGTLKEMQATLKAMGQDFHDNILLGILYKEASRVEHLAHVVTSLKVSGADWAKASAELQLTARRIGKPRTSHRALATNAARATCHQFQNDGRCRYGDRCRFSHADGKGKVTTYQRLPKDQPVSERTICFDFQKGRCSRPACRFHHIMLKCTKCGRTGHGSSRCEMQSANVAEPVTEFACVTTEVAMSTEAEMQTLELEKRKILADSACTSHLLNKNFQGAFSNLSRYSTDIGTTVPGSYLKAKKGSAIIEVESVNVEQSFPVKNGQSEKKGQIHFSLKDAFFAPESKYSLLSLRKLAVAGNDILLSKNYWKVLKPDGAEATFPVDQQTGFWYMNAGIEASVLCSEISRSSHACSTSLTTWHKRLGHRNLQDIQALGKSKVITGYKNIECKEPCEACVKGKATRAKLGKNDIARSANKVNDVIFADYCGPFTVPTLSGCVGTVLYVDAATGFVTPKLVKKKSDQEVVGRNHIKEVERTHERVVGEFHTDQGGEFSSKAFAKFLESGGTKQTFTPPDSSTTHNPIAERVIRTVMEMAMCMLFESGLPLKFWGAAVLYACDILNSLPSKALRLGGKTPFELWHGRIPSLRKFRVFGCNAFANKPGKVPRLESKVERCVFFGFSQGQ